MDTNHYISKLGLRVKDKVTGFTGVVDSISFDLYGCVQATINPGMDKDGKLKDTRWFDIERLEYKSTKPVMKQPDFVKVTGPALKPKHKETN